MADQRAATAAKLRVFELGAVREKRLLALGGFDESIRWTTDCDLWACFILDGALASCIDAPLAYYLIRACY